MFELGHHLKHFNRCLTSVHRQTLLSHLTADVSFTAKRTTFILKRKFPVRLTKYGETEVRLKGKDYVYDLVLNSELVAKPNVNVILKKYVEGVGLAGDVLNLPRYKAYNELLLPGLADYASPDVVAAWKEKEEQTSDIERTSSPHALMTAKFLERLVLSLVMNKDTPWTIKPWHVRVAFRKAGVHVPETAIQIPDKPIAGPDLNLEGKDFVSVVTINGKEKANVRCRIHHWSTQPSNRVPWVKNFACYQTGPIFEEQEELLNKLPLVAEPEKSLL